MAATAANDKEHDALLREHRQKQAHLQETVALCEQESRAALEQQAQRQLRLLQATEATAESAAESAATTLRGVEARLRCEIDAEIAARESAVVEHRKLVSAIEAAADRREAELQESAKAQHRHQQEILRATEMAASARAAAEKEVALVSDGKLRQEIEVEKLARLRALEVRNCRLSLSIELEAQCIVMFLPHDMQVAMPSRVWLIAFLERVCILVFSMIFHHQALRDAKAAHADEVARIQADHEAAMGALQSALSDDHQKAVQAVQSELQQQNAEALLSAREASKAASQAAAEGAARYFLLLAVAAAPAALMMMMMNDTLTSNF